MRPYSKLQTENLGLVLLIARAFAYIGFILLLTSILSAITSYLDGIIDIMMLPAMAMLPFAMFSLFGSAVLAFLVAIEETYREKVERSVGKEEV